LDIHGSKTNKEPLVFCLFVFCFTTTKPPLQKILQGILHTESESKQNHEGRQYQTTGEEKARKQ
jgi:hypothetical protein